MKIINKEILVKNSDRRVVKIELLASVIAQKARPGQFVVVMVHEKGERIPLTVVDKNLQTGTVTLIFQEIGLTTKLLGRLNQGDEFYALIGPLGHASQIQNFGRVVLVGGGVGVAEIYPVAKALKEAGNHVQAILGARSKDFFILEKEIKDVCDEFYAVTDDGSYGRRAFTTDILKELLEDEKPDYVYSVGPIPMMKIVSSLTQQKKIKTVVSLNALMVDATGMCGCCRVSIAGHVQFSCVDGPEFDAHQVDWLELEQRNRMYEQQEQHVCRLLEKRGLE
ncbi:MAG: sulfide/dihydroorotate dehydrogenase-like FAD/NAD-binding protein [Candidatus Omnitrophota bacterium]